MEQRSESQMIAVSCACGKQFRAKPELAGRKVKCPQCQDVLVIPAAPAQQEQPAARLDSLLDDMGVNQAASADSCPQCKRPLPPAAVICVECGYHLEDERQLRTKSLIRKPGAIGGPGHLGIPIRSDMPKPMKQLVSVSKAAGIVCLLLSAIALSLAALAATIPDVGEMIRSVPKLNVQTLAGPGFLSGILGVMALIVSNKARQGLRSARTLGLLTGLLMLPLVPVVTLFGLLIIILLLHPDTKRFYR